MRDSSFDLSRLIETVRPGLKERLGSDYDVDGLFGAGAGVGTGAGADVGAGFPGAQIQLIQTPADDESFRIEVTDARHARVVAGARGLRYGLGRLLRESRYEPGNILFSPGQRESRPQRNLRGVYFATHFHNFYHAAPLEQIGQYIGELSLWGANALLAWLDLHHYASMDQAQAAGMVQRVRQILLHAQSHGMKPGLTMLANEAYSSSPPALRAQWRAGQNGYHAQPQGHYHVELCPSTPEGWSLLLAQREEMLDQFADLDLGFVVIWPYDQGGCTCAACAPWGGKGYLKLAEALAGLVRRRWPAAKIILSTWYFDRFTSGEWDLLRDQKSQVRTWADQLMVGSLADSEMAVPADIGDFQFEMVGFPEISMWGTGGYGPWCGFGAGPYPHRLQKLWEGGDHRVAGALSYSESLADDLCKVVCLNHLWGDIPASQSIREYAGYELSPAVAEEFATLIGLLESTLPRQRIGSGEQTQFIIQKPGGVQDACDLAISISARLPASRRESWRWRQIVLRTIIDRELIGNDGRVNAMCNEAAMELRDLYCAASAASPVAPITLDSLLHPIPW